MIKAGNAAVGRFGSRSLSTTSGAAPPPTPVVTLKQVWKKPWQTGTPASLTSGSNPMTVAAGSTLVAFTMGFDSTRQVPLITDGSGTFSTPTDGGATPSLIHTGTFITVGISTQVNASGGSHTITVPTINDGAGGTNGELGVWICEVTNMRATQLVRDCSISDHLNTSLSWTNVTDSSPVINDIVFGMSCEENSAATVNANMSNPPTGWTAIAVDNDATLFVPTTIYYKIVSGAGVQTASISTTDPNKTEDVNVMLTLSPT
jgi:hypothetical protein